MKFSIITILLLGILYVSSGKKNLVSSNYDCVSVHTDEGRCTGSSSCRVCKNCSRCAHCSNGGTCGVCAGTGSYKSNYDAPKPAKTIKTTPSVDSKKTFYTTTTLKVKNTTLNLRKGPGVNFEIVEKLSLGDELIFIESKNDWIYVKVVNSQNKGWVHSKYVK